MNGRTILVDLRNQLAAIYQTEADARRIAGDAGLVEERIAFGGSAINIWTAILHEAVNANLMDALLAVVLREYDQHTGLEQACTVYREFASTGGKLRTAIDAISNDASPFKGLEYFREEDSLLFFGREMLTAELVGHLRHHRFLAIVGASGSGKSSLVRAGLVPALRQDKPLADGTHPPKGSEDWPIHVITPTARPLRELAKTLMPPDADAVGFMDKLLQDARTLDLRASQLLASHATSQRLLLVVDQFEELFTLCHHPAERSAFVSNLLYAAEDDGVISVVMTLRADFYPHCAEFEELRHLLEYHQKFIGPMSDSDLRQAIEKPAQRVGLEFEAGLVDRLLDDVRDQPGALPLLSHALHETWKRRDGHLLTHQGYTDAGEVAGAIARTADRVYQEELNAKEQAIARNIFLRLTALGEGVQDTRRRVPLNELTFAEWDATEVEQVLNQLADARLIIKHEHEVEVAHEALIGAWRQLREWLEEDREGLVIHRRLTESAQEWARLGHDSSYLYQGTRLAQVREWAAQHKTDLNEFEQAFLERSGWQAARLEQSRRRRTQWFAIAATLALIAALAASWFGWQSKKLANDLGVKGTEVAQERNTAVQAKATAVSSAIIAQSRQLAAQAETLYGQTNYWLQRSALLSAESLRRYPTADGNRVAAKALSLLPQSIYQKKTPAWHIVLSHNRSLVATNNSQAIQISRLATGAEIATLSLTEGQHVNDFLFAANDKGMFISLTQKIDKNNAMHSVIFWDFTAQTQPHEVLRTESASSFINLSLDGNQLATTSTESNITLGNPSTYDTTVNVWNTSDGSLINHITSQKTIALAYSHSGLLLALGSQITATEIISADTGVRLHALHYSEEASFVEFSPDDKLILIAHGASAQIWDAISGESRIRVDHTGTIYRAVFSADSKYVATVSRDNILHIWETANGKEILTLNLNGSLSLLEFSPDAHHILIVESYDLSPSDHFPEATRIYDIPTGQEMVRIAHDGPCLAAYFDTTGKNVLTLSTLPLFAGDHILSLWGVIITHEEAKVLPDENLLARVRANDRIFTIRQKTFSIWDPTTLAKVLEPPRKLYDGGVNAFALSPNGQWIALQNNDGKLRIWDAKSKVVTDQIDIHDEIIALRFSNDGQILASSHKKGDVSFWNTSSGHLLFQVQFPHDIYETMEFSPNNSLIALMDSDYAIYVLSTKNGKQIATMSHEGIDSSDSSNGGQLAFDPTGQFLATRRGRTIRIWKPELGREVTDLVHSELVYTFAFSPDGHYIVTGANDKTARVWDVLSGREIFKTTHNNIVTAVAFSPDGQQIVTGETCFTSCPAAVTVWSVFNGNEVASRYYSDSVNTVAFRADGRAVITGNYGWTEIWLWQPDDLVELICKRLPRNFTQEEWTQYFGSEPYRKTCPALP